MATSVMNGRSDPTNSQHCSAGDKFCHLGILVFYMLNIAAKVFFSVNKCELFMSSILYVREATEIIKVIFGLIFAELMLGFLGHHWRRYIAHHGNSC